MYLPSTLVILAPIWCFVKYFLLFFSCFFVWEKGGALRAALNNCRYFILNATYPPVYRLHAAILPIGDLKQR